MHVNWPGVDPYTNFAASVRVAFYGVGGVPYGCVDGVTTSYPGWMSGVTSRLAVSAPISFTIYGSFDPALLKACVKVRVHCESAMSGAGHMIYVALVEDDLYAGGRHYNRVLRMVNENGWGTSFTISPGQDKEVWVPFTIPSTYKQADLKIIAWVQSNSGTGRAVQNSIQEPFSILEVGTGVTPVSLGNIKASYK